MTSSRRNFLQLGALGAVSALSGCTTSFGNSQESAAVVVENNHDTVHLLSVAVSTQPDDGGGYTEYFSETLQIQSGERETFEQGLAFTDYAPNLFAMTMIDDETTSTTEFELGLDVQELRVQITENGQIQMTTVTDN